MGDTWSSEEVGWFRWVLGWAMIKSDSDAEIRRESSAEEGRHPWPLAPQLVQSSLTPGLDLSVNVSSTTVCQKASQEDPWQFSLVYLPESCLGANEEAPYLICLAEDGVG